MDLAFETKAVREVCEKATKANRTLGEKAAEKLRRRLADIEAADCVADLVAGNPREASNGRVALMNLDLDGNVSLTICPNHIALPQTADGRVDWQKVTRVKILKVERRDA